MLREMQQFLLGIVLVVGWRTDSADNPASYVNLRQRSVAAPYPCSSLVLFLLPGGRPRRFGEAAADIHVGGRPRRFPLPLARCSIARMASSIWARSWRSSASIFKTSMPEA
jgi:hypothetical protein